MTEKRKYIGTVMLGAALGMIIVLALVDMILDVPDPLLFSVLGMIVILYFVAVYLNREKKDGNTESTGY